MTDSKTLIEEARAWMVLGEDVAPRSLRSLARDLADALEAAEQRADALAAVLDAVGEGIREHDARVWDEGAEMGHRLYAEPMRVIEARNPYRRGEQDA